MKIYFVVNAFMPNKKAYGMQIAKMCEAFIEAGVDLELIIPQTARASRMREFYGLRVEVPTKRLFTLPWYDKGRAMFFLSSIIFMMSSLVYLWTRRTRGAIYSVDLSTFSFAQLPLAGMPVCLEVHDAKPKNIASNFFFRRVAVVIATNAETKKLLQSRFAIPERKMLVEPNGVDPHLYTQLPAKDEARKRFGLPHDAAIALYVGRFYDWKGLRILSDAAIHAPETQFVVVGGTAEEFAQVTGASVPKNLLVMGESDPRDVPAWLAAADALLILGTKTNEQSYRHTAPMKLYEYMSAKRPVIASATPALKSIIPPDTALWYESDSVASLVDAIRTAIDHADPRMLEAAAQEAARHTWAARVARIANFL